MYTNKQEVMLLISFTAEHTPAEIVKIFPKASDLFKERRIDFCCGGDYPLSAVFTERLDGEEVLEELNRAFESWRNEVREATDWDTVPLSELADHITSKHHQYLNEELPALEIGRESCRAKEVITGCMGYRQKLQD